MESWLSENWFYILSSVVGFGGLWFSAFAIHNDARARKEETKARKVANLLAITASHREVWKIFLYHNELMRVRDNSADTAKHPITHAEQVFVNLVIQHVNSVYYTINDQFVVEYDGFRRDIAQFFSLPIPREVWGKIKIYQNDKFVAFVESCRNLK